MTASRCYSLHELVRVDREDSRAATARQRANWPTALGDAPWRWFEALGVVAALGDAGELAAVAGFHLQGVLRFARLALDAALSDFLLDELHPVLLVERGDLTPKNWSRSCEKI